MTAARGRPTEGVMAEPDDDRSNDVTLVRYRVAKGSRVRKGEPVRLSRREPRALVAARKSREPTFGVAAASCLGPRRVWVALLCGVVSVKVGARGARLGEYAVAAPGGFTTFTEDAARRGRRRRKRVVHVAGLFLQDGKRGDVVALRASPFAALALVMPKGAKARRPRS